MPRRLRPARKIGGTLRLPGDKSIAHRAAMMSLLSKGPITIENYPSGADCNSSLRAVGTLGVDVLWDGSQVTLKPRPDERPPADLIIECGNSGTTTRLLAGIIAGHEWEVTLAGDTSLSRRPMRRIIEPLTTMGARLIADDGHLPMKIQGRHLMPLDYRMPVASAQVKSSILLAGLASGCSVSIYEDTITRDHTELMINHLGGGIAIEDVKPVLVPDPDDPRKRKLERHESYKRRISLSSQATIEGGQIDIPGDISTAAFFFAAAAISGGTVMIENLGLNPTRTGILDHLRAVGCRVDISKRQTVSGEVRGTVTVTGGTLKPRRISGAQTVALIDEIPIVAVMAAFATGTTVIRDAKELRVKESDRLEAIAHNLRLMGIKCGLLEDGLAVEPLAEPAGADFLGFGDHRIAMAFSVASLFLDGPSTIDDDSCVGISCPEFFELLETIIQ
ncbi:MAG: 3-phosphoshikimate 1-carboxyvinyltransferase [bacterium]